MEIYIYTYYIYIYYIYISLYIYIYIRGHVFGFLKINNPLALFRFLQLLRFSNNIIIIIN